MISFKHGDRPGYGHWPPLSYHAWLRANSSFFVICLAGRVSAILARTLHLCPNSKWRKRLPVCECHVLTLFLCPSMCAHVHVRICILYACINISCILPCVCSDLLTIPNEQVPHGAAEFTNSRDSPFRSSHTVSIGFWSRPRRPNRCPGYCSSQVRIFYISSNLPRCRAVRIFVQGYRDFVRPGTEVLDMLLYETQSKSTRMWQNPYISRRNNILISIALVLTLRPLSLSLGRNANKFGDFVSHGLPMQNTYGSNRTHALETVEQRLSKAEPILEASDFFAISHIFCHCLAVVCYSTSPAHLCGHSWWYSNILWRIESLISPSLLTFLDLYSHP